MGETQETPENDLTGTSTQELMHAEATAVLKKTEPLAAASPPLGWGERNAADLASAGAEVPFTGQPVQRHAGAWTGTPRKNLAGESPWFRPAIRSSELTLGAGERASGLFVRLIAGESI